VSFLKGKGTERVLSPALSTRQKCHLAENKEQSVIIFFNFPEVTENGRTPELRSVLFLFRN